MLKTVTSLIVLIITTSLLLACTEEATETLPSESKETSSTNVNSDKNQRKDFKSVYQKPGAAVRLKHNYDGHSNIGEPELLQLIFSESYNTGVLNIDLKVDQGLTVSPSDNSYSFAMQGENFHHLEIRVEARTEGKHYLKLFVSASESNSSLKHRVFAIPLYAGDSFLPSRNKKSQQDKSSADNLIFLPSKETIIQ